MTWSSSGRVSDEPRQHDVEVGLLLGADAVAAHLAPRHRRQVQLLDQLVDREVLGQVRLVAQHQERDAVERRAAEQVVQLLARDGQRVLVGAVDDVSGCVRETRRGLERRTPWRLLLCSIAPTWSGIWVGRRDPNCRRQLISALQRLDKPFQRHMAALNPFHIKPHRRNRTDGSRR
jgi:hypothetical protein